MGRKKSKLKLPFLKLKVDLKIILNIAGMTCIVIGLLLLFSFLPLFSEGAMLWSLNQQIVSLFGMMAILLPIIILFSAGHFFSHKKLQYAKTHVTIGSVLIFIALTGLFRGGSIGETIYNNLVLDFTAGVTVFILLATLILGLVLFLDTSIDILALAFVRFVKWLWYVFQHNMLRNLFEPSAEKKEKVEKGKKNRDDQFIEDQHVDTGEKTREIHTPIPVAPAVAQGQNTTEPVKNPNDITMRPLTATGPSTWVYPPLHLLADINQKEANRGDVARNADVIEKTLDSFGVRARVVELNKGPTVTRYALSITMGTKLSKITALANDLALALAAPTGQVRIEAPIPGRSLVGIEIPNITPELVTLKRILSSDTFVKNPDPLLVPLGLDVSGMPIGASIRNMPHVLIAGTTGSGKSVMMNAWITSFLFRTKPEELRLILVDPKRVELSLYNGIPHLLTEVIVEPGKILKALAWTVGEMESRYKEFATLGVRNLEGYNELPDIQKKPYIIFIIDELADLMMFAARDAEDMITRIAQMARATGIHLVLATQRPSVDVITGLMKANIPTRLAFNVSSLVDSRVIIDTPGAEKLLGKGDMLYLPPDQAKPRRVQGPYIMEKEVHEVVKFLRSQAPDVQYTESITTQESADGAQSAPLGSNMMDSTVGSEVDPLLHDAINIISQTDRASASLLQRKLKMGYARAARILDQLHEQGYIGPADGSKPREVIKRG